MTRPLVELTGGSGDTTTSNTATWVPADSYVDTILEASVCHSQLSGVITCVDYDMQACDGDQIQIRYIRKRTAQPSTVGTGMDEGGANSEGGACLSTTSSTVGTQAVQILKIGDYDTIPGFTEFEVCGNLRAAIMNEMSKALAERRDEDIWNNIYACHPHHTEVTSEAWSLVPTITGSCCTYGFKLYEAIVGCQKTLEGHALHPDTVVLHPTVAKYLYFRDANGGLPNVSSLVKFGDNGTITSINGLKVIECCNALEGTGDSGATLAVVLDSSRAVAEAWGKRPTFSHRYIDECDHTREVLWMYWGSAAISGTTMTGSVEAVAHVVNP